MEIKVNTASCCNPKTFKLALKAETHKEMVFLKELKDGKFKLKKVTDPVSADDAEVLGGLTLEFEK